MTDEHTLMQSRILAGILMNGLGESYDTTSFCSGKL